ncbi:hypothetical protein NC652_024208 [Populus alba x Populus x berolinensis]|nr:hypothetical protein NC652_024208 [Populus alba x Populus x berolinensis]
MIARCDHEQMKSAEGCIAEIIGEYNPEHFLGTQDTDMRKKFQEHGVDCHLDENPFWKDYMIALVKLRLIPVIVLIDWQLNFCCFQLTSYHIGTGPRSSQVLGVSLIFGLRNALFLEPPSAFQQQLGKNSEEQSHMSEFEAMFLKKRTKNLLEIHETGGSSDEKRSKNENLEIEPKRYTARKGMNVKDRPQIKKKKAKVPNPLSVQKKKNCRNSNSISGKGFLLCKRMSEEHEDQEQVLFLEEGKKKKLKKEAKKARKCGVRYTSRVPPDSSSIDQVNDNNKSRKGGDGAKAKRWVEFASKSNAKRVANLLNGGKKRSQFYYDHWNIKYLSKFKWDNLTDKIAYKKAIREQELALEISAAKRERDFYLKKVDLSCALSSIEERMKKDDNTQVPYRPV